MIEQFWLFHCGYAKLPEAAIFEDGSRSVMGKLPFLAAVAFHSELGPILVDAPFGHDGARNMGALYGALLQRITQTFKPEWSIIPRIEQLGLRASEIEHILMTHLHFDHTGGMKELGHARFHVSEPEWSFASSLTRIKGLINGYAVGDWRALRARIDTFEIPSFYDREDSGRDIFGDGSVFAHSLPGHSPGHTGYRFVMEDGREIFFMGDAVFNVSQVTESRGFGWFPNTFGDDPRRATYTLEELRAFHAQRPEVTLLCAHDFELGERCMRGPIQVMGDVEH